MADFDRSVSFIVAQPFLIRRRVQGVVRRHIPDYLLLTDADPVLVDVKPREQVSDTKVAETFDWTHVIYESRLELSRAYEFLQVEARTIQHYGVQCGKLRYTGDILSELGNSNHLKICHQCDFAGCTNPAHMRLGTNATNG